MRVLIFACCLAAAHTCPAAEQVLLERESKLYSEPQAGSAVVSTLKEGSAAEVIARKAAWLQIKSSEVTGWLFSFNVRFVGAPGTVKTANLALPKARGDVTSTMGIRGIDEEDLRQARLDSSQLQALDGYVASPEDASASAQAASLNAANLPYFDAK